MLATGSERFAIDTTRKTILAPEPVQPFNAEGGRGRQYLAKRASAQTLGRACPF
jgi:hypothetical protein